jgi:hypothetical protein
MALTANAGESTDRSCPLAAMWPMLNRSRRILWLIAGGDKAGIPVGMNI